MSRTQHEADLCALLVDDVYGELPCRIITVLLQRGRLPTDVIIEQTGLRPTLLKQGLVVLIQQNLVYYYHNPITDRTFYEANWDAAFALARSGRIIDLVEERFGEDAKDVVQNLLLLGHTKVGDLVEAYAQKKELLESVATKNRHANGDAMDVEMTNGDSHQKTGLTHGQLDSILYQLLQCGYLQPVTAALFKSPADTYDDVEQEVLRASGGERGTKGSKKAEEIKNLIRSQLKELREKDNKWTPLLKGNKRPRDAYDSMGPDKRRKLANGASVNGVSQGLQEDNIKLDPNMVIRVNHEKLAVALRNQHLVEVAEKRIGVVTSFVYSKLLALMEDKIPRCRPNPVIDDPDEIHEAPSISILDIVASFPNSIDLSQGIGTPKEKGVKGERDLEEEVKGAKTPNSDLVKKNKDSESDEDVFRPISPARSNKVSPDTKNAAPVVVDKRVRMEQTRQHLLLLAADRRQFVTQAGGSGRTSGNSWTVDFEKLGEFLRDDELDACVYARYREEGVRIIRVLREKGKLDEKLLANFALMKITKVRSTLIDMQMVGFVDIQEVPKDTTRVPVKTFFLWSYDTERITKLLTDTTYKAMSRALQRLDTERFRDKEAIETSERTDVDGNLEMLSAGTGLKLTRFLRKEELLAGLIAKLDKTAAVFREY